MDIRFRGMPPVPVIGGLTLIVVLLFSVIYTTLVVQQIGEKLSSDWYQDWDVLWRVVVAVGVMVGPLLLIVFFFLRFFLPDASYCKHVQWDDMTNHFSATEAGWFHFAKTHSIPLDDIVSIGAHVGPEGDGPIDLEITVFSINHGEVTVGMAIDQVDKRDEALDVLFRAARASGLTRYVVDDHDVDLMTVSLLGDEGNEDETPIPAPSQAANYELDQVSSSTTAPKPKVANFDPDSFDHPNTKVTTWEPGQIVRFRRPAVSLPMALAVGVVAAVVIGFLSGSIKVALGALFIGTVGFRIYKHEYEVELDWSLRRVSWRREWFRRSTNLENIKRVDLRGIERVHQQKNRPSYSTYLCRIELVLDGGGRVFVVDNGSWERTSDRQREQLEPLTAALAESVDQPWRWIPFEQPAVTRAIANIAIVGALLFFIGILCVAGFAVYQQGQYNAGYFELVEKIKATGAQVEHTSIDVDGTNIFSDGLMITIKDPKFGDEELESLLKLIDEYNLFGLDISGTSVSDNGMKSFVDRYSTYLLIARDTKLTGAGAKTLAQTNISCLDVRDTEIQLGDLKNWSQNYALKVAYFSDDQITEQDHWAVEGVPYLDYIFVNDETATRELVKSESISLQLAPPPTFYQD